jgi:hypothetical protein
MRNEECPRWLIEIYLDAVMAGIPADDQYHYPYAGQTLGIDEEFRAQRMIECCNWNEEEN